MCRTVHAMASVMLCGIQMTVRTMMTVYLLLENSIKTLLQTLFNLLSFLLQMVSLIPISITFLLSSRLKCFMCGGGGLFPAGPGGPCDCMMSALALILLYFVFRATGVLDKIYYSFGYAKVAKPVARYVATPGDVTECSRNDTETTIVYIDEVYPTSPYGDDSNPISPTTTPKVLTMSPKALRMTLKKSKVSPKTSIISPKKSKVSLTTSIISPKKSKVSLKTSRMSPKVSKMSLNMSKTLPSTPKGSTSSLSTVTMGYSKFWRDLWDENITWNYPDVYSRNSEGTGKTKLLYYVI